MSNKFRIFVLAVIAAGCLAFAACSDSNNAGSTGGTATSSTHDEEEVTAAEVADALIYAQGDEVFYEFCGAVATVGEDSARYEFVAGWESEDGNDPSETDPDEVFDELVERCGLGA